MGTYRIALLLQGTARQADEALGALTARFPNLEIGQTQRAMVRVPIDAETRKQAMDETESRLSALPDNIRDRIRVSD